MRIAAIDIGTNSIHMIVVQVRPDLSFEVVDREKEMVRLGAGGLDGRSLTATARAAALHTLGRFKRLAESHKVDEILAAATSATREADNGGDFIADVAQETGIRIKLIPGPEEARLIHLAAAYGVDIGPATAVVIDIGGGSVEVTLGTAGKLQLGQSFKAGVIRLTERFVRTDPLSRHDYRRLARFVSREMGQYLDDLARRGFDRVIGTSGTILSLGTMVLAAAGGPPGELRNQRIPLKALRRLRDRLLESSLAERLQLPGMDPRRADLSVAGVVLLDTILRRLGARDLTLCDLALREGLVLDYIERNGARIRKIDRYPDVRRRSVIELGERCRYWPEHARQVASLALQIFDQTRSAHGLGDREREWLEFGALLHDVGVHISYERHHRHSYYLIKNGDLRGFSPEEIEIIALVARYHRQATPKKSHEGYGDLGGASRKIVKTLSAMVRLAEGLDRSHAQVVAGLDLHQQDDAFFAALRTAGDAELELWAAHRHVAPLEEVLGRPIRFEVARTEVRDSPAHVEQVEHAARVPGKAVRGRRDRRVGQDDAARPPGQVAQGRRPPRVHDGVELVGAGEGGDENRQEEELADADDVQPAPRHRLRRSPAVQRHPAAQGRHDRSR
jgi:exopolyphosphatase/guanosine-5'-triphosphate,3'-diphosphate pyrophosphatase